MIRSHDSFALGLRTVALFEAAKGSLVLLAGFGLLTLIHHNVHALAAHVLERMHLNPAHHFPRIFLDAADRVNDGNLWLLAALALTYSIARAIEAYGLWRERVWAEWFALASGAVYVPFEVYELTRGVTFLKLAALLINVGVIAYMAFALRYSRVR